MYTGFNGLSDTEIAGRLVEGISAIAVPILPRGRDVVGSLAINMTSARLRHERLPNLIELLRREVDAIEESINPMDLAIKRCR